MSDHTPRPWGQLLRLVRQIDNTAIEDLAGSDLLIDLNIWLMDAQEFGYDAQVADAAPDLLAACEALIAWDEQRPSGAVDGWAMLDNAVNKALTAITKAKEDES